MKIWTSYYAKMRNCYQEYAVVGISTSTPVWFPVVVDSLPEVHPGWELVFGVKNGDITYDDYKDVYLRKLSKLDRCAILEELRRISDAQGGKDIVLTCYEKPGDFCHRYLLGEWLDYDVQELA